MAMHLQRLWSLAFLLGFASIVGACDEHDMNCSKVTSSTTSTKRTCRWRVKQGQIFQAIFPSIYETNIGDNCHPGMYPPDFGYLCESCSASNMPCQNSHAACGGCDCPDPDVTPIYPRQLLKLMQNLSQEKMMTHMTCDYVKQAFKNPNYNVVDCDDEKSTPQGNISAIRYDVPDTWNESVISSGIIEGGCSVESRKIGCQKVPFLLKFECDDCVTQGSPMMLTECCTKCQEFVEGLATNDQIPDNVLPIGFCSGCNSTHYSHENSPMPDWDPELWADRHLFEDYTEEKALAKYDEYIEENICVHLTPHCKRAKYVRNEDYELEQEECLSGSCPFDPPQVSRRRLESLEPSSESTNDTNVVEDPLFCPNLGWRRPRPLSISKPKPVKEDEEEEDDEEESIDVKPKAIIKMTMGLPGSQEMYQTEEAKTALKHGCANTLDIPESWISVSLKVADGGRRLSDVSVEFTINVPPTSAVATDAITQSIESVNNAELAMNLQESFAEHAPAVDVATVDFTEVTVSNVEVELGIVNTPGDGETSSTTEKPSGPPSEGILGMPVTALAIVGGAMVLCLGLIAAGVRRWRKSKHNLEEANKPSTIGSSQPKEADQGNANEAPVVPQVQDVPV